MANLSKVQVNTTHVMCVQVTSGEKWSKQVEDFCATAEVYRVANDCDECQRRAPVSNVQVWECTVRRLRQFVARKRVDHAQLVS